MKKPYEMPEAEWTAFLYAVSIANPGVDLTSNGSTQMTDDDISIGYDDPPG